jgi:hypothetical protein
MIAIMNWIIKITVITILNKMPMPNTPKSGMAHCPLKDCKAITKAAQVHINCNPRLMGNSMGRGNTVVLRMALTPYTT